MTDDEKFLDELNERSKNDRAIIVGSEVRRLIAMVRERDAKLDEKIGWRTYEWAQARISQLESALKKLLESEEAYGTEGNEVWDSARGLVK